jgi:hypothetical protein
MRRDIDDALHGWPYEPEPGETLAREIRARDGRTVIQVRQDLGILQMETEGRPDGVRPHGYSTYLDYLRQRSAARSRRRGSDGPSWVMSADHCVEVDREFVQYYHRRMAWLALQRYDRMLADADHTLALMDFVRVHCDDPEYVASHERFRGLVLFHRSQAAAALALERRRPEQAIDAVLDGARRLAAHQRRWEAEHDGDDTPNETLIEQLHVLEREIRRNFDVSKTLQEQLDEAVATEDYERAALLRDQIRGQARR